MKEEGKKKEEELKIEPVKEEGKKKKKKKKEELKTKPSERIRKKEKKKKKEELKIEPRRRKGVKRVKRCSCGSLHVCLITKMPLSYKLWKLKIAKMCF